MSEIATIHTIPAVTPVPTVPLGNGSTHSPANNEPAHGTTVPERLSPPSPQPYVEPLTPQHRGRWWRRTLVFATISIVIAILLVRWADYRISHVVARQAVVKGVVSQVGARIAGRVAEVMVQPNQRVRKGDILAQLDDLHFKATVESAQADLAKANAEYEVAIKELQFDRDRLTLEASLKERQVSAAAADVNVAEAQAQRWRRERERIEQLTIPGVVTGSEKDEIIALDAGKAAALVAAKERLEEARVGRKLADQAIQRLSVSEARLVVLRKNIDLAQANVKSAEADMAATVIRARKTAGLPGNWSRRADRSEWEIKSLLYGPVIKLWIEAWVDESDLGSLKVGNPVDLYLAAYPDQVVPGRVEALGVLSDGEFLAAALPKPIPTANNNFLPVPTNVAVRISVLNPEIKLMPGLTAVVGIHSGYRNPAKQWLPASVAASITSARNFIANAFMGNTTEQSQDIGKDQKKIDTPSAEPDPNLQAGT